MQCSVTFSFNDAVQFNYILTEFLLDGSVSYQKGGVEVSNFQYYYYNNILKQIIVDLSISPYSYTGFALCILTLCC